MDTLVELNQLVVTTKFEEIENGLCWFEPELAGIGGGKKLFLSPRIRRMIRLALAEIGRQRAVLSIQAAQLDHMAQQGREALSEVQEYLKLVKKIEEENVRLKSQSSQEFSYLEDNKRLEQEKASLEAHLDAVRAELAGEVDRRQKAEANEYRLGEQVAFLTEELGKAHGKLDGIEKILRDIR